MSKNNPPAIFISAKEKEKKKKKKKILYDEVKKIHSQRFPFNDYLYDITWEEEE
mgnify:CR=1 FL=1